ncbi:MAG: hypothetical protein OJF52_000550 [Nitrospira sp.]|nr:MAG: hypothetical protein OJF52_000550 [Nitrospira sp.]
MLFFVRAEIISCRPIPHRCRPFKYSSGGEKHSRPFNLRVNIVNRIREMCRRSE